MWAEEERVSLGLGELVEKNNGFMEFHNMARPSDIWNMEEFFASVGQELCSSSLSLPSSFHL